jgi:hypothetical protein
MTKSMSALYKSILDNKKNKNKQTNIIIHIFFKIYNPLAVLKDVVFFDKTVQ